jgi:UDP-N-acetyl-D-glucosamine dehydrogenase
VKNAKILVLGVAYKKDIDDVRESPALDVIALLLQKGARVSYHDPYIPKIRIGTQIMRSVPLGRGRLAAQYVVVITTNHTAFDYPRIVREARLIVDTRNATKGISSKKIVKL